MSSVAPLTVDRGRGESAKRRPLKIAVFSPSYGLTGMVGGVRWWFLSRYLAQQGADVTVFHQTADPGGPGPVPIAGGAEPREIYVTPSGKALLGLSCRVAGAVYSWLPRPGRLRTLGLLAADGLLILSCSGRRTVEAFDRHYGDTPPDVIVASCVGWGGVTPALTLCRRGIPFLLEFRDPWRTYHADTWPYHYGRLRRAAQQSLALANVTPLLCERDAADFGKESLCFPHAFPPELLALRDRRPRGAGGPLTVSYFGAMLYEHFNYADWFRGLAAAATPVRFNYTGRDHVRVGELARAAGIEDRVSICPRVGYWDVFPRECASDALLMFGSNDPNEPELFGFKSIEIRAAGRPVVLVGPKNERLHAYLASATRVLWATNPEEVTAALNMLAEDKRRDGDVTTWTDEAVIRDQCWDRLAARLLDELSRRLPARN